MLSLAHQPVGSYIPSFANSFARNASQSAFPELWQGLKGAWCPSLGVQGRKLYDMSGYGRHASFSSGMGDDAWIPSPWGWALKYDGTDDCLDIGTNLFDLNTNFSLMARVRVDDTTHNTYSIIGASVASSGSSGYFIWLHRNDKNVAFTFLYDTGPGSGQFCTNPSRSATANTWYTLLLCRNASAAQFTLFQDDYAVVVDTTNPSFSPSNTQSWAIGSWDPATPTNCFKGQIGDVLAWDRALSPRELELLGSGRAHPLMAAENFNFTGPYVSSSANAGSMMLLGVGN